jgi:tetratricopeptide (TPR) repeat protein
LVGLLLFLGILVLWAGSLRKVLKDGSVSSTSKDLLIGVAGGMVALLVQSISNFPLQVAPTAILFGFYLAAPLALRGGSGALAPVSKMTGLKLVLWMVLLVLVPVMYLRELAVSVAYRDTVGETSLGHGALAVSFGSRLVQLAPSDAKAWSAYAKALQSAGQSPAALDAYQRVLSLDPDAVEEMETIAEFQLSQGHSKEAVELSKKALAIAPLYGAPLWPLAVGSFQLEDFAGAASAFERYIALSPNEYQPYLNLGVCYMRLGRKTDARAAWEKAHNLNPSDPQVERYLKSLGPKTK